MVELAQDTIKTTLSLFLFAAALVAPVSAAAGVVVRDGDTIVVDGQPWRLQGVDAPELKTRSGQDARRWMVAYLRGKEVTCKWDGSVTYDRKVGVCRADGDDIGAAIIAAGYALDCARYSDGRYARLETPAAQSRIRRASYCSK